MERPATNDDVITCPLCGTRDGLTIRWIPKLDHQVHGCTEVGCAACGKWFSAKEDRWAITEWNNFAIEEWRRRGVEQPNAELYRLLLAHYYDEMAEEASASAVDIYLMEHILPLCPFKVGDRFEALIYPHGVWSVRALKAVYGINTGAFWIIESRSVQPSGHLGDNQHEFWQRDAKYLRKTSPFLRPTRWYQVVAGDECIHDGATGILINVDTTRKTASISIQEKVRVIRSLAKLRVPVTRFEHV